MPQVLGYEAAKDLVFYVTNVLLCQAWLRDALASRHAGPTVVVTHFAPSLRSADPRYGLTPGTAGFCNALDEWLAQADWWLHGHLHCRSDYVTEPRGGTARRCHVLANPRGYFSKGEQEGFVADCVVDLASAPLRTRT